MRGSKRQRKKLAWGTRRSRRRNLRAVITRMKSNTDFRPVVMVMDDPGPVGQAFVSYWRERLAARVSYSP